MCRVVRRGQLLATEANIRSRLEATFGVIAAAAPALRPLLGQKRRTGYSSNSASKSHSRPVPLVTMQSHINSHRSWIPGQREHMQKLRDDDEPDVGSDGGSSQHKLWTKDSSTIVKTTDIDVVHEQPQANPDKSNRSDSAQRIVFN